MKWLSTRQERIGGFLIQFEVYHQDGKAKPFTAYAYHGPHQVAKASAKTEGEARSECREAYVKLETSTR